MQSLISVEVMRPTIAASVLNADLGALRSVCIELEHSGIDAIQWDVMDGHFVPNLTMGASVIKACRKATALPFEAHLMIDDPDPWIAQYIEAGCEYIIVHAEATKHLHSTLRSIGQSGTKAGVALNPATPLSSVVNVLDLVDLLLIMTVEPGFGGQSYLATMEPKIAEARAALDSTGRAILLEVDGGINATTVVSALSAGADRFVVGSALFVPEGPAAVVASMSSSLGAITVDRTGH